MLATEFLTCSSSIFINLFAQAQSGFPPGINMENFLEYTPIQRQLISHLLTLGVSAMACGFVYFLATLKRSAREHPTYASE